MNGHTFALTALLIVAPQQRTKPAEVGNQHQAPAAKPPETIAAAVPHQVLPGDSKSTGSVKKNGSDGSSDLWKHADFIQVATAGFTGLYFVATVWILWEMRRANARERKSTARSRWLTRNSNKLTVESLKFTRDSFQMAHLPHLVSEDFKVSESEKANRSSTWTVTGIAQLKNAGTTGANNVVWGASFRELPAGERFTMGNVQDILPDVNGQILSVGVQETFRIRRDHVLDIDKIFGGDVRMYFVGLVWYQDDFENWHEYRFSFARNAYGEWPRYHEQRNRISPPEWFVHLIRHATDADRPPLM